MEKYNKLIEWLVSKKDTDSYMRGCVLMDNDVTGFLSSKLCQKVFGKENTLNIIMPCYSNDEYLFSATKFSRDCGVESKNILMKQVYDDILELDYNQQEFSDSDDGIKTYLRDVIIETLCKKNKSFRMGFEKTDEGYEAYITGSVNLSITFTLDELKKFMEYE